MNALQRIRDIIQRDIGNRGLARVPEANLINACPGDFEATCRSIAETEKPHLVIVTGFYIPQGEPPAAETDGPLGALFLARALVPLGIHVSLFTEHSCVRPLITGLRACGLDGSVQVKTVEPGKGFIHHSGCAPGLVATHFVALERVGPSHTTRSIDSKWLEQFQSEVPAVDHDCCHNMRGRQIAGGSPFLHRVFEAAIKRDRRYVPAWFEVPSVTTIGIGDGGNEIGMGKIPWDVIRRNIPNGGLIACRVPTDYLIVAGVSNWGAYGLAAGVRLLRGAPYDPDLFDVERERELLRVMVEQGPLVDGVTGRQTATVDGLDFDRYAEVLRQIGEIVKNPEG